MSWYYHYTHFRDEKTKTLTCPQITLLANCRTRIETPAAGSMLWITPLHMPQGLVSLKLDWALEFLWGARLNPQVQAALEPLRVGQGIGSRKSDPAASLGRWHCSQKEQESAGGGGAEGTFQAIYFTSRYFYWTTLVFFLCKDNDNTSS